MFDRVLQLPVSNTVTEEHNLLREIIVDLKAQQNNEITDVEKNQMLIMEICFYQLNLRLPRD